MNNRFLKRVTQNHCLGFLVMYYQEILGKPGYLYIYTFGHMELQKEKEKILLRLQTYRAGRATKKFKVKCNIE